MAEATEYEDLIDSKPPKRSRILRPYDTVEKEQEEVDKKGETLDREYDSIGITTHHLVNREKKIVTDLEPSHAEKITRENERYPKRVDAIIPLFSIGDTGGRLSDLSDKKCQLSASLKELSADSLMQICSLSGYDMIQTGALCKVNGIMIPNRDGLIAYLLAVNKSNLDVGNSEFLIYLNNDFPIPIMQAVLDLRQYQVIRDKLKKELDTLSEQVILEAAKRVGHKITFGNDSKYIDNVLIHDKNNLIELMIY